MQPLQTKWVEAEKKKKKCRPLQGVMSEIEHKVVQAALKLQRQLANNLGKLVAVVPSSVAMPPGCRAAMCMFACGFMCVILCKCVMVS